MAQPFEVIGKISNVETFAAGGGIRERAVYAAFTVEDAGASERASRKSGFRMVQFIWLSYIGMRQAESADAKSRSNICCRTVRLMAKTAQKHLVVCIDNEGYLASLERRKIYVTLRDTKAEEHGLMRIIDESGEDYLYPKQLFRLIALPQAVKKAVLNAA